MISSDNTRNYEKLHVGSFTRIACILHNSPMMPPPMTIIHISRPEKYNVNGHYNYSDFFKISDPTYFFL